MSEEKICPFMSRRSETMMLEIYCKKERCMAWGDIGTGNEKGCRLIK